MYLNKKKCPGDLNNGKRCYKVNDFLKQGYKITNQKYDKYNINYTLIKKSWIRSDKLIICRINKVTGKGRCTKP